MMSMSATPDLFAEFSQVTMVEASEKFSDLIHRTTERKERTIITQSGHSLAALVPLEDFALLQKLEDLLDYQEAIEALDEPGENISLDELKKEVGLS
jgi:prevent-host-death family protein